MVLLLPSEGEAAGLRLPFNIEDWTRERRREKIFFFSLGDKQQFRQMEMTRLSIKIHIYQFYSNDNS